MQDKRIDEKFVNHAWEQMLATLDREMPAEEKRRRIVFIPWRLAAAASVLLLLTVGAGWWLANQNSQLNVADLSPAVSTQKEQVATKKDHISTGALETAEVPSLAQKRQQQEEALQRQQGGIAEQAPFNLNVPAVSNKNSGTVNKKSEASGKVETMLQIAGIEPIVKTPTTIELNSTIDNTVIAQNQTEAVSSPSLKNQSLQTLNTQQIAMLEKEAVQIEAQKPVQLWTPVEDKKESSSKWNIGVELATYASADAPLDGYAGGAIVEVPVKSEKINLRTGLNFNSQQRYFDSTIDAAQADRGGNPSFGASAVVVDPNPDLSVRAQQLSFPVTLEFKPRKSWGLEGGFQASYLLGAQNLKGAEAYQTMTGLAYGNQEVKTLLDGLTHNDVTSSNAGPVADNSNLNVDAFRRLDVAVSAGFGYYPTQNIGVRLQYQRGLIDLLKADQFKTFGNNVRLSAVYFFGK